MRKPEVLLSTTNRKLRLLSFLVLMYILIGLAACEKGADYVFGGITYGMIVHHSTTVTESAH